MLGGTIQHNVRGIGAAPRTAERREPFIGPVENEQVLLRTVQRRIFENAFARQEEAQEAAFAKGQLEKAKAKLEAWKAEPARAKRADRALNERRRMEKLALNPEEKARHLQRRRDKYHIKRQAAVKEYAENMKKNEADRTKRADHVPLPWPTNKDKRQLPDTEPDTDFENEVDFCCFV